MTLACLLGGPLLVEGCLRFFIFGPSDIGASFRDPARYADPLLDDDYWKLRYVFAEHGRDEAPKFDAGLGWLSELIEPKTLRHRHDKRLRGRRPVLLYGASFAKGGAAKASRFEALLEKSDLSASYGMLNYAIGGQGVDQVYLLLQRTLGRYSESKPVVVIGLVTESDLDRCVLSFRDFPKPRLGLEDGRLLPSERVLSVAAHLSKHPVSIRSYAWNHVVYGSELLPARWRGWLTDDARKHADKRELIRAIVFGIKRALARADVDYFFLLFHTRQHLPADRPVSWQESFITEVFEHAKIPYVSTRRAMLDYAERTGTPIADFYRESGGHLTEAGNRAAFEAIRQGLLGERSQR